MEINFVVYCSECGSDLESKVYFSEHQEHVEIHVEPCTCLKEKFEIELYEGGIL